ncbi:MAG: arginine--tRNA ligase [Nevskiales bacterium]
MKTQLADLVAAALKALPIDGLADAAEGRIQIERTRDASHGDYACNIAMMLAKQAQMPPRQLAEQIVAALPESAEVTQVEIAGPGFINFFISASAQTAFIAQILEQGESWGQASPNSGPKTIVEFVSANPTGPLHVGHGRGAAFGASVANLLAAAGHQVHREYYVNDAGRQMDILGTSVWLRYLQACGEDIVFPKNGYQGEYIRDYAEELLGEHDRLLWHPALAVFTDIPADEPAGGDKEAHIDALIARAKQLLGDDYEIAFAKGLNRILDDIRDDLAEFGVVYDEWFSERGLVDNTARDASLKKLSEAGYTKQEDGAIWFKSTEFGDDKDRVLIRANGEHTYFASDVAYHLNKLDRGFTHLVDIWGADHHGYIKRVNGAVEALTGQKDMLDVRLVQFVSLFRGGEKQQMSTRSGEFITLRELREEVGNDAARFFYIMRSNDVPLDFDLELAKSQSNDNPVYYIQYAHARVCRVMEQAGEKGFAFEQAAGMAALEKLNEAHEQALLTALSRYPEVIAQSAANCAPHTLGHYLRELADAFHSYYNAHQFLVDDADIRNARLSLVLAVKQVIANGLKLLGVSAPTSM